MKKLISKWALAHFAYLQLITGILMKTSTFLFFVLILTHTVIASDLQRLKLSGIPATDLFGRKGIMPATLSHDDDLLRDERERFPLMSSNTQLHHLTGVSQVDFFSLRDVAVSTGNAEQSMYYPQDEHAIEDTKSPWIAGALSLVLPGAGEFYAGNYLKSGIFLGIEAGLWTTAAIYDKKGDDHTAAFEAYANEHWSAVRYARWVYNHAGQLNPDVNPGDYNDVFQDNDPDGADCPPPFDCLNWERLHDFEREISLYVGNGFTHVLPYYGQQQYYELIGKYEQFSRGWDDSDPSDPPDQVSPVHSTSQRFFEYAKMRADANSFYDVSTTMVSLVVINHVLSAIDAVWTASQHNKALHAEARMRMQATPFGAAPVQEVNVSLDF